MKPTGEAVAQKAIEAVGEYSYNDMDCQALVEYAVQRAGGSMDYRGSNHMAREAVWLGTLDNARAEGKLVPGAGLLIAEPDESGLPAQYRGDGLGDFSHVGLYVGENALEDVDKRGKRRACNVVHSSASMGRTAGSTLANGWTHCMWFKEIDYGVEVEPGVTLGAGLEEAPSTGLSAGIPQREQYAMVRAENGSPVKLRKSASTKEAIYWLVNCDAVVKVERNKGDWSLVTAICADGHTRRGYMMRKFLALM